jgi:hypothetical protein
MGGMEATRRSNSSADSRIMTSFAECGQIESEEFAEEFAITLEGNPKGVHTNVNAARKVRALPACAERSKKGSRFGWRLPNPDRDGVGAFHDDLRQH